MTPAKVRNAVLALLQKTYPNHRIEEVPSGIAVYDPDYPDNAHHAVLISFHAGHVVIEDEKKKARRVKRKSYARQK